MSIDAQTIVNTLGQAVLVPIKSSAAMLLLFFLPHFVPTYSCTNIGPIQYFNAAYQAFSRFTCGCMSSYSRTGNLLSCLGSHPVYLICILRLDLLFFFWTNGPIDAPDASRCLAARSTFTYSRPCDRSHPFSGSNEGALYIQFSIADRA